MKTMHLFAGGGGGLLADLILGHEPIAAVEWEKSACDILRSKANEGWFPELRVYEGDVRVFDPSDYEGRVDCIHAGFPCQDISVAGKQAGLEEGTRSGLYREVLRIAGTVRPRYLFLENVAAILNNGLGTVLGDLAALGYDTRWCCIRASDVGAPHGRDRWWCLAELGYPKHNGQPTQPQLRRHEAASNEWREEESSTTGQSAGADRPADVSSLRACEAGGELADTASARATRHTVGTQKEHTMPGIRGDDTSGVFPNAMCQRPQGQGQHERCICTAQDCNREASRASCNCEIGEKRRYVKSPMGSMADGLAAELGGLHRGWYEVEPNIGRTAPKRSTHAAALKALGNGQVPLQAALAWMLLQGQGELFA